MFSDYFERNPGVGVVILAIAVVAAGVISRSCG